MRGTSDSDSRMQACDYTSGATRLKHFQTLLNSQKICPKILKGKAGLQTTYRERLPFSERPGDVIRRWRA